MANRDEHGALVAALDRLLFDEPDAVDVELVVDHVRLERRPLLGQQRVRRGGVGNADRGREAQHPEVVFGLTLVVLLPVRRADARLRRHQDSRLRTVDARLP